MKVTKDGKEVKNATVVYDAAGNPAHVTVDGVNYDPSAYELEEDKTTKKTKTTPAKNSSVMTTEDVK